MVKSDFRKQQKIKDEQINFLLGDLEKNLEDYWEAFEIKEKQLTDAKRILISTKQSFDKISKEKRDLKAYIENLKQHFQRENEKQQLEFLKQQKAYYNRPTKPKKYKKVILEEEEQIENEQEFEEEEESENEEIEQEPQIKKAKRKNKSNIFEYINKNAKRHKQ